MAHDHEVTARFSEDVDRLLAEHDRLEVGESPDDYAATLAVARRLAAADFSQESAVRASLRRQVLAGNAPPARSVSRPARSYGRALLHVAALLALMTALVLAVPSLRTLAQNILREIGQLFITDAPTYAEQYVYQQAHPLPTLTPGGPTIEPQVYEPRNVSREEAEAQIGFPVYAASYVPEGYLQTALQVLPSGAGVMTEYVNAGDVVEIFGGTGRIPARIAISQARYPEPHDVEVGDATVVDVTVNGQPGVWIEGLREYPRQTANGEWEYLTANWLFWEQDGYNFNLRVNDVDLGLDEVLRFAESVAP